MRVTLPYGSVPYPVDVGDRDATVVRPVDLSPPPPVDALLAAALEQPRGGPPLAVPQGGRVTLIVSDASRSEPREALVAAVRSRIPNARITLAIATGTHGPCGVERLGLSSSALAGMVAVVDHDGHSEADHVELGTTSRGTPVRVHRCLVEADLVVATGCIRPHYFAGFGAGVKALFPGLGEATAIRTNHRLKTERAARAGIFVGNPCRDDLEEAAALIPTPTFLLNGVCGPDALVHAAVAGDVIDAFRVGAALAKPWFTVTARPAPLVIASDALPVSASLYQAAKIAAAAAPLVAADGVLAIVAECGDGTGPLDVVNEAIFRIGVIPRLPAGVRLVLVSSLGESVTKRTLLDYAPSVAALLDATTGPVTVIPRASQLICEPRS